MYILIFFLSKIELNYSKILYVFWNGLIDMTFTNIEKTIHGFPLFLNNNIKKI
jgi:hypothetical protein